MTHCPFDKKPCIAESCSAWMSQKNEKYSRCGFVELFSLAQRSNIVAAIKRKRGVDNSDSTNNDSGESDGVPTW